MKKTKIVCTIGPSCNKLEDIKTLIKSGMDVARLNMSHGEMADHQIVLDRVKKARRGLNVPVAIMVDTCGPELRIGKFENGSIFLEKGQAFVLSTTNVVGDENKVYFGYPKLLKILKPRQTIYANNGLIELVVLKIEEKDIVCKVAVGGWLSDNKSISIPHVRIPQPFISKKDYSNIEFAVKNNAEYISASFVNKAKDVLQLRELLNKLGGKQKIIAKIESEEGIKNLESIISVSDGIMVARGDMGTEIPIEEIPAVQKNMIKQSISQGKSVIVATEMLESMISRRRPTRAETTDVAQAIYDKTSATMLSGETASGEYPFVSCQTMSNIALATEKNINYDTEMLLSYTSNDSNLNAISYSACSAARSVGAKAIVCFTDAGKTACMISCFRPGVPIVALTHDDFTYNMLSLCWGTLPIKIPSEKTLEKMIARAKKIVKEKNIAKAKDKIIITLGIPADKKGVTNSVHICEVN